MQFSLFNTSKNPSKLNLQLPSPSCMEFSIDVEHIPFTIQRKSCKHAYIRIKQKQVHISLPKRSSNKYLQQLIEEKWQWINEKYTQQSAIMDKQPFALTQGEKHYYLGNAYALNLSYAKQSNVALVNDTLQITIPEQLAGTADEKEAINQCLLNWYRKQFDLLLPELIDKWQNNTGLYANEWRIKRMKTRWGTCNIKDKRIWLNLALIRMPIECIEHVMVHELTHLLETGHNKRFYALMDKFMPNWREYDQLGKSFSTFS